MASIELVDRADVNTAASLQFNDIAPIDNFSASADVEATKEETPTVEATPDVGVYEDNSTSGDVANQAANETGQTVEQ